MGWYAFKINPFTHLEGYQFGSGYKLYLIEVDF